MNKTLTLISTALALALALTGCAQTQPRCTGINPSCSGGGYNARAAAPGKPAQGKPIGISKPTPSNPSKPGRGKGDKNHGHTGPKGKK